MNAIAAEAHEIAVAHGWWEDEGDLDVPLKLALIHSEVSEALEDYRVMGIEGLVRADPLSGNKPAGLGTELADVLIRTLDLMWALGLDIDAVVAQKQAYNRTRPFHHGNKRFG